MQLLEVWTLGTGAMPNLETFLSILLLGLWLAEIMFGIH